MLSLFADKMLTLQQHVLEQNRTYLSLLYGLMSWEAERLAKLGHIDGDVLFIIAHDETLFCPEVIRRAYKTLCSEYTRRGRVDLL